MANKQIINPAGLPDPGPRRAYSHAVRAAGSNVLYLAGQTGSDAQPEPGVGRFEAQTRRTFDRCFRMKSASAGRYPR